MSHPKPDVQTLQGKGHRTLTKQTCMKILPSLKTPSFCTPEGMGDRVLLPCPRGLNAAAGIRLAEGPLL